jgi:hypothetical protein
MITLQWNSKRLLGYLRRTTIQDISTCRSHRTRMRIPNPSEPLSISNWARTHCDYLAIALRLIHLPSSALFGRSRKSGSGRSVANVSRNGAKPRRMYIAVARSKITSSTGGFACRATRKKSKRLKRLLRLRRPQKENRLAIIVETESTPYPSGVCASGVWANAWSYFHQQESEPRSSLLYLRTHICWSLVIYYHGTQAFIPVSRDGSDGILKTLSKAVYLSTCFHTCSNTLYSWLRSLRNFLLPLVESGPLYSLYELLYPQLA